MPSVKNDYGNSIDGMARGKQPGLFLGYARDVCEWQGNLMAAVFGEHGPKGVEALEYPTRQRGAGVAVTTPLPHGASISSDEGSFDEGEDRFGSERGEGGAGAGAGAGGRFGGGGSLRARTGQLMKLPKNGSAKVAQRWMSQKMSSRKGSSAVTTSQRFAQPLASEGKGSVFSVDLPLSKRRGFEVEILQRFDRLEINSHVGEFWFLIDSTWISNWIDFVMGKTAPPGPISNLNLFDRQISKSPARRESMLLKHAANASARNGVMAARPDLKLKPRLQKLRDYRAVHPLVWYIFREIYTTDESPDICRWRADVYSDDVNATRKFKLEQKMHVKAVYELRRFCGKIKNAVGDS